MIVRCHLEILANLIEMGKLKCRPDWTIGGDKTPELSKSKIKVEYEPMTSSSIAKVMAKKITTKKISAPKYYLFTLAIFFSLLSCLTEGADQVATIPGSKTSANRVASILLAQDFLNEQIALHSAKAEMMKEPKLELDPEHGQIFLRGKIQVPTQELRAINLDPSLGLFKFQLTIKPEITKQGYLILEFPLSETYFYPYSSKDPVHDRVIVPVQMLSLALASARGYLAALSGDFSGFDRRTERITALIKGLDRLIATEKNADAVETLKTQRDGLRIQLEAVPIERKQLQTFGKEFEHILGFTGEKELNLNSELGARRNALILKVKLSQLAPFLNGVELGGIRMIHDKKDGAGQNYLAIDVNSVLEQTVPPSMASNSPRPPMKVAPSLILRFNQALFESEAVVTAEKKAMSSKIRDLNFAFKDDGLHITGGWHTFFFTIPFDAVMDFVTTGLDTFEIRVQELKVAGIDLEFLSQVMLESIRKRIDHALKNTCTFDYVGSEKDHTRALQVKLDTKKLLPAFPDLHLVEVDVREREFLMKIGRP